MHMHVINYCHTPNLHTVLGSGAYVVPPGLFSNNILSSEERPHPYWQLASLSLSLLEGERLTLRHIQ